MSTVRVRLGWAAGLLLIAALEFVPSYDGVAAPLVFGLAALVPIALVWLGHRAGAGTFWPALVTIALAAGVAWIALHSASDTPLGGLGDALPRLLTTPRPAPASAQLLAPPALLVALVATIVATVVLGAGGSGIAVPGLLAPVVGSALVYAAAQLLSAGAADPHGIVAVCLVAIAAFGWSVPHRRGATGTATSVAWRPSVVVPVVGAAVVALGAASLTSAAAFDPRTKVTPPSVHLDAPSPLNQLSSWTANPSAEIMRARVTGTGRLRLATLSRFTGSSWQVEDSYRQLGLRVDSDLPFGSRRVDTSATVQVVRLAGLWLPAPGLATSASVSGVLVDPDDGALADPQHARPGLTYTVHASVDAPSSSSLEAAPVPQHPPARYLDRPDAPAGFAQYARAAIRGASTALEEAIALEHAVSTGRRLAPRAPSGSSYARLQTFLFGRRGTPGAQVGTQEQFAAGFALLAREVGLPTRLVVGFVLDKPGSDGTVVVRGRDASVWPEVYFEGAGWVPFAPTPGGGASGAEQNLRQSLLKRLAKQSAVLPVPPPVPPANHRPPGQAPVQQTTTRPEVQEHGLPAGVVAAIVAAGVVLGLVLLLAGLRALRTARHRRRGARGAWAEVVDLLVLLGRRPGRSAPAPELAAELDTRLNRPGAAVIAAAADREAFAPPGVDHRRDVWQDLRVLRRRAHRTLPRYRRALLPLDPRPLLPRIGKR